VLEQWPAFDELAKRFAAGEVCLHVAGLASSARALVIAELLAGSERPALVIVPGLADAHRWTQDLRFFGANVAEFPEEEPRLWHGGQQREADAERAVILRRLLAGEALVVVATPAALAVPLPPPAEFRDKTVTLAGGDRLDRELLVESLALAGYERVETVGSVGQWAARGGIVDIFSPAQASPARVEFFGDEIESIRLFDPTSQRSTGTLEQLVVLPVEPSTPRDARLLTYLGAKAPVIVDAPRMLEEPVAEGAPTLETLAEGHQRVELAIVTGTARKRDGELTLDAHAVTGYAGKFAQLCAEIERWRQEGFRVRLVAGDLRQGDQLHDILREHGLEAAMLEQPPEGGLHVRPEAWGVWGAPGAPQLQIVVGDCSSGFSIPALGLVVLTEHEIFGAHRRSLRRPKYQRGAPVSSFTDLAVDDLIVHEDHGIGRYLGLKTMNVGDKEGDFLLLEYAEGNQLFLPVERLELISKYLGGEESAAKLDRLGGAAWQRVKESVRAALREMAEELLKLYAQRAVAEGHAFSPDTPWQREFEAAFRFEETPDQLRAIKDVKADMLSEKPMDRLVAGDVGYGKTEVALRAAFKAVADGKQVAVLVPTTVLAHQHWTTFADRFSPFPARVELLSRFRSPKEQKAVVEGLKQGTVDVVIGTHRLLSKDVAFKNLGLLVVDEEHRFGVAHKERMKQLRTSVDVLALTATPIPRTLYMSLSGVRDMSVIETPPIDRLPIETVVRRFSKVVIREALVRELERGGQVFFVHNRIQSLASMAHLIQSMVPEARVLMAHGQMKERELEAVMVKFITGQADVLVSTAIVESGLDIPASNTIIVNRADRFGLAQLYQLRGRVGRERQQAYCYLLVPADGRVDEQAQKRLRVLQELTDLGSGFKLAMRDLEIRGAGNLLGAQQHGHIAAVGYDLYSKLLAEAVRELSGQPSTAAVDPVISAPAEGFLPEEYVPEVNQRLALYKRLAGAGDEAGVADIRAELADRFGPLPLEAEQLLDVVRIRLAARRLGIEKVEIGDARALLTFAASTTMEPGKLLAAIRDSKGRLKMKRDYTLEASIARGEWPRVRDSVHGVLEALAR
jgi:transcription-repair coupling factor (superfamily II helicase)